MLEEGVSDHCHKRVTMKALPGSSLEVVEAKFLFQLLMGLIAAPSRLDDLTGLFCTKRCEKIAWKGTWVMSKKRFSAEQIVTLLRQIEVLMAQGKSAPEAWREAGISQQNFATSC